MGKESISFNPDEHKEVEEGGFVKKEAAEKFDEAEKLAEIASALKEKGITAQDILRKEALYENMEVDKKRKYLDLLDPEKQMDQEEKRNMEFIMERTGERKIPDFATTRCRENWERIPEEFKTDRKFVMEAVKKEGGLLYYMHEFKSDKEVVLEAVKQNKAALDAASEELRSDPEVILQAARHDGEALQYVPKELRSKEVVLEAVKNDGLALKHAPKESLSDKAIVLEAVKQNGYAITFAFFEQQKDLDVILEAVKQNPKAIDLVPEDIREKIEGLLK